MARSKNTPPGRRLRLRLYIMAVALATLYGYFALGLLGFPDGHLTSLDRAKKAVYPVFMGIGAAMALYFYLAGWHAKARRFAKWADWAMATFLATLTAAHYILGWWYDDGQGG